MTEQLPPEGRLTDDQRARLRAGLLAAAEQPVRRARPWLAPAAAAASIAVLAAGVTVTGLSLADDGDGPETAPVPSGQDDTSSTAATQVTGEPSCDQAVGEHLPGATPAAKVPYGDAGTTYLYATDTKWVVCDTWSSEDGGPPTVTGVHAYGSPLAKDLLLISQNYSMTEGVGAQYFAAGALIPGVRSIQYSFPDGSPGDGGHLVDATMTDDMWVMQYLLPDPPRRAWTEPVKVAVVYDDGTEEYAYLSELDLCAQVNHGC